MTDRSKPLKGWAGPVMSDSHEGDEVRGLWPVLAFGTKEERDAYDEAQREIGRQEERAETLRKRHQYAVHPGFDLGRPVSASQIAEAHRLPPGSWFIWDDNDPSTFRGRCWDDYEHKFIQSSYD